MSSLFPKYMSNGSLGMEYFKEQKRHKFWTPHTQIKVCEDEEDITGKVVIVTGSNTGIGKETVFHLARRSAKIIMACRDLDRANAAMEEIKQKVPDAEIETMKLELGDIQSIKDFVKEFQGKYDKLDILVNNAGLFNSSRVREETKDKFELHMGVNHLGVFLLTRLLLDLLKKSAPSRIVCVSSQLIMAAETLDLNDLMMEKEITRATGDSKEGYQRSKLANFICMRKLARELENSGVKLYQVAPGFVKTDIARNQQGFFEKLAMKIQYALFALNVTQGCETVIYCCVSKSIEEAGGKGELYLFCKLWDHGDKIASTEEEKIKKLYEMSEELVGLRNSSD